MARTQRMRQRDRKTELVEIAYRLIAQNGLEGFRIRQVAAEAGIDNGTLHYHFPSKEALIHGVVDYFSNGNASQALRSLEATAPYELAQPGPMQTGTLYPAYMRGLAYLQVHDGAAAAAEFRKVLYQRGVVLNFVTGALAHLQLGRAYQMAGDTAKAKSAYQDFLTLWKDADADIPIYKQAKAEYAKLQ